MSAVSSSVPSSGLAPFQGPVKLPDTASAAAKAAKEFTSALHCSIEEAPPGERGRAASGLAAVFCPRGEHQWNPALAKLLCPFETSVPERNTSDAPTGDTGAVDSPASLEGVFRDDPEDSIEPAAAWLFWRRPERPPAVAAEGKSALAEALRRAGFNPRDFAVSYWETKGEWPGGMMIVPQLTVVGPNGQKVDLSPELVVRTPNAAIEDIRRALLNPAEETAGKQT
jgi:hypothetical protein